MEDFSFSLDQFLGYRSRAFCANLFYCPGAGNSR